MPTRELRLDFGGADRLTAEFQFTDNVINQIAQSVPDSFQVDTPMGQYPITNVRRRLSDLLRNVGHPKYHVHYSTQGDCRDVDGITIDQDHGEFEGGHSVELSVLGVGVTLDLRANVFPKLGVGHYRTADCSGNPGQKRKQRTFTFEWVLDVALSPGTTTTMSLDTEDHLVHTPCCTAEGQPSQPGAGPGSGSSASPGSSPGATPGGHDCLHCSNPRYQRSQQGFGSICIDVTNVCAEDFRVLAQIHRLGTGVPGAPMTPGAPFNPGQVIGSAWHPVPARVTGGHGGTTGVTIVCVPLDREPKSGETYRIVVGPDVTGTAGNERVDPSSPRNCLHNVTIP